MTLVETMVAVVGMTIVFGGSLMLLISSQGAWQVGGNQSSLQEIGRRILNEVLADLRRSGLTAVPGQNLPAVFQHARGAETDPRGPLQATMNYQDVALVSEVLAYQGNGNRILRNAGRVSEEVVFQLPSMIDAGDPWGPAPIDATGNFVWSPDLVSYRVVDLGNVPWLIRYRELNGAVIERRTVGPWVTSITFDVVFNDRSMRFGEVAVVVYLERTNNQGQRITASLEGSVVLRNTREL